MAVVCHKLAWEDTTLHRLNHVWWPSTDIVRCSLINFGREQMERKRRLYNLVYDNAGGM